MMNGLKRLFGAAQASSVSRDPTDDFWYFPVGAATPAGVAVTRSLAYQAPTVLSCLQAIAQPISALPLQVFRRRAGGEKQRIEGHPVWDLFARRPAPGQTALQHRAQMVHDLMLDGNYLAHVRLDGAGRPTALIRMGRDNVDLQSTAAGPVFRWRRPDGATVYLDPEEVFHIAAPPYSEDGVFGLSTLALARRTIGKAVALQDYAERFFANDATPPLVLKMAQSFKTDEDRKGFMASWAAARTGANRHKAALLEYGVEVQQLAIENDKAQFIETAKECDLALARIFRVPPHKLGILDKATFSNIEHQALEFVTDTLTPWLVLIEQAIMRDFLHSDEDDVRIEFNVGGLLRGDLKTRYEAYAVARNWGWLSVNDIRRLENQNPIDGGDRYLEPLNMTEAGGALAPAGSALPPAAPPRGADLLQVETA